jgi:hypothetical protein
MNHTSDVRKLRAAHEPHCATPCHVTCQRLEQMLDMTLNSQKCLLPGEQITGN